MQLFPQGTAVDVDCAEVACTASSEQTCERVYIIEINPFGAHSSSGSALFNWKTDFDLLYGIDGGDSTIVEDCNLEYGLEPVFRVAEYFGTRGDEECSIDVTGR